jgi:hypothetical protein
MSGICSPDVLDRRHRDRSNADGHPLKADRSDTPGTIRHCGFYSSLMAMTVRPTNDRLLRISHDTPPGNNRVSLACNGLPHADN